MKDQNKPSLKKLAVLFLSFFGAGFAPFAPGTIGSIAAVPLLWAMSFYPMAVWPIICLFTLPAVIIAGKYGDDPSWIVIDEVIGMIVTWSFWPSAKILDLTIIFVLFRIFDITKIWPASIIDKKMKSGLGIVLDDVVAGIYAGIIYLLWKKFIYP